MMELKFAIKTQAWPVLPTDEYSYNFRDVVLFIFHLHLTMCLQFKTNYLYSW